MGVHTKITLQEVKQLFPSYNFQTLIPTKNGVIDTTYILDDKILKRYERKIDSKINNDAKLLQKLHAAKLNVPRLIDTKDGWYLYEKLHGKVPKNINYYHIQALARFIAKMHQESHKNVCKENFFDAYDIDAILHFTKRYYYSYFKKLQQFQKYSPKNDGFIHGDIFKDNTVFNGEKIGVFDFIDGGYGEFSFDIAVALVAFNPQNKISFLQLFLKTYNHNAPKKIALDRLQLQIKRASQLYALLRINKYKNPKRAKTLANLW